MPLALGAQTPWVTQLINYALVPGTVYAKQPDFDDKMAAGSASFAELGLGRRDGQVPRTAEARLLQRQPERYDVRAGDLDGRHRQGGDGGPGLGRPAGLPRGRAVAGRPRRCSRCPATDTVADNWIPGGIVVGLAVSAKSKKADAGAQVHRVLRPAGDRQRLGRGGRLRAPVLRGRGEGRPRARSRSCRTSTDNKAVPFMDQRWPNAEVQPTHFAVVQELLGGRDHGRRRTEEDGRGLPEERVTAVMTPPVKPAPATGTTGRSPGWHRATVVVRGARAARLRGGDALPEHRRRRLRLHRLVRCRGAALVRRPRRTSSSSSMTTRPLGALRQHPAADGRRSWSCRTGSACCSHSACTPRIKSRMLLRVIFFAPVVVSPVMVSFLWKYVYNPAPDAGLNAALGAVGLGGTAAGLAGRTRRWRSGRSRSR